MDANDVLAKGESVLFLNEQVSDTIYVPESSSDDAIEAMQDGLEFTFAREEIERKTVTNTIEASEPRLGKKTLTGTIPMEFKAGKTAGAAPRGAILYESLLGGKHQLTEEITTTTGNTVTSLKVSAVDAAKIKVGSCILIKEPGKFEARPVKMISVLGPDAEIELAIPLKNIPSDGVKIEKSLTYFHDTGSKPFSATHYPGGEIKEKIWGLKSISASLESWTVNETPSWSFSVEGLDIDKEVAAPSIVPDFTLDPQVPVIIHACAWLGQEEIDYSELGLSIENTKADLPSACNAAGKIGTRKTAFNVTANINPYMASDNLDRWNKFKNNQNVSLFTYAFNPTTVDGEFKEVVAIWIPNFKITNMPQADQDGVLIENIEGRSFRKVGKDTIFMSFI